MLWINTITATALGMALAFEPTEPGIMAERPRDSRRPMLSGFLLWRFALVSVLIAAACFGVFGWVLGRGGSEEIARTAVVNTIVAALEVVYLFSVRRGRGGVFTALAPTPALWLGIGVTVAAQAVLPTRRRCRRCSARRRWAWRNRGAVVLAAALFLAVLEAEKALRRRV